MKVIICDICGKVLKPQIKPHMKETIDYETIKLGKRTLETCTECCGNIRRFVETLQEKENKL